MFKTTSCIAALALSSASAVDIHRRTFYRPPAEKAPWYSTVPKEPSPDHPVDYFVPNFGEDHEISSTKAHTAKAEKDLSHVMQASFSQPAPPPRDYFVPNFGEDHEITSTKSNIANAEQRLGHVLHSGSFAQQGAVSQSDPICSSAGCTQYKHKKKARGYDINYPVPNFGVDRDILDNHNSLSVAEGALAHKLEMGTEKSKAKWHNVAKDTQYNFAPKLDQDIRTTQKNLGDSETTLGHKWVIDDLQLESEVDANSDPICSSAGCTQYKHKKKARGYDINYPVPNFGVDKDIIDNHASLVTAEGALSHKLEMGTEKSKAKWHNVAKDTDYNFAPKLDADVRATQKNLADSESNLGHKWVIDDLQVGEEMNTESDPICSSAGCTQYKHKKKARGYDINYPVPNFGVDRDILDNHHSLSVAEGALSHKLEMGTEKSKAKWHNVAKDTDYNFAPKLDADVRTTQKNLADSENNLGHKWVIDDIQLDSELQTESDPICSSAGCTQYKHKKKELGYDINYPVPNFGRDNDINENFKSLTTAEGMIGHHLNLGTAESKAKWKNPAKEVDYNFKPALDGDVVITQKNLGDAESNLGHHWVIDD